MPKRFNFRFSGILPTFCRPSKHTTSDPFLSFLHRVSRLPPAAANSDELNWTKSHNWHVLDADLPRRKIYNSAASSSDEEKPQIVTLPPPRGNRRTRILKKNKKPFRLSVSSADSELFSDDGEKQIVETLVSNSTDSSADYSPHLEKIREAPAKKQRKKRKMKKVIKISGRRSMGEEEARLSAVFRRLVPRATVVVEGKVRESLAVVKRSEEPYEDFKKSMVEMIVEKEMVEDSGGAVQGPGGSRAPPES